MPRKSHRRVHRGRKLTKKQVTQVKRIAHVGVELKHYDVSTVAASVPSTGTMLGPFSVPPQGITEAHRIGDQIHLKNFQYKLAFIGADTTNFVRIVWFRWYEQNSIVAPVAADIFETTLNPIVSGLTESNVEANRIHVLSDRTYSLSTNGTFCAAKHSTLYGKRLGKKKLIFIPAASLTGDGHIYCFVISDSIAVSHPSIYIYTRLIYSDA